MGEDVNNLTTSQIKLFGSGVTMVNGPWANAEGIRAILVYELAYNFTLQIGFTSNTAHNNYLRFHNETSWTSWVDF